MVLPCSSPKMASWVVVICCRLHQTQMITSMPPRLSMSSTGWAVAPWRGSSSCRRRVFLVAVVAIIGCLLLAMLSRLLDGLHFFGTRYRGRDGLTEAFTGTLCHLGHFLGEALHEQAVNLRVRGCGKGVQLVTQFVD